MNRQSRALLTLLLVAVVAGTAWVIWRDLQPPAAPPSRTPIEGEAKEPPPRRGGTLTVSLRTEPRSFNRLTHRDVPADLFAQFTLGRLVRINRATQEVEPWLAERWSAADDGRTFTFTLRDGVRWSDGVTFTAEDVRFSLETTYDPRSKAVSASALTVDGRPLAISTPDPRTVVITFPAPFGPGLRILDNLTILPRHKLAAAVAAGTFADAWGATTPPGEFVSIGPFVLLRHDTGERLVFERNPSYWRRAASGDALPYLDRVVLEIVRDQNAELARLQAGQIDMTPQSLRMEDIPAVRPLEQEGRLKVLELGVSPDPDSFFLNLKAARWTKDPRAPWVLRDELRQAISHAVDREAFAEAVFRAAAVPIHGPVTPGNKPWFAPGSVPRYEFSPEKARALLAAIGLENRDDDPWVEDAAGTEARFNVLTFRGNSALERGAAVLREELRAIGIDIVVVPLEAGALIEQLTGGTFEAIYFNFSSTDLDPATNADFWLSSGSAHVWNIGQKTPATPWERELDALAIEQARTIDVDQRKRLFNEMQTLLAKHVPILYFAAPRLFMGITPRVQHLAPAVTRPHLLWSADTIAVADAPAGSR